MTDATDECQYCGAEDPDIAFVKYHADPNDAQERTDWFENLPLTIYGMVCMSCGNCTASLDPRDLDDISFEQLPKGTSSGHRYRVEDELE